MPLNIVMVPGCWHSTAYFNGLISKLSGYSIVCEQLPSVGSSTATLAEDSVFLRDTVLKPLLDMGDDIIMVMHSYGSVPGNAAVDGLDKTEREKKGMKGGVVGLVWLTGFLVPEGKSMVQMLQEEYGNEYMLRYCAFAEDVSNSVLYSLQLFCFCFMRLF